MPEKSISRQCFEARTWAFYQSKKAAGWSDPAEGDPSQREALFWLDDEGAYGVLAIEHAWQGWRLAKADSAAEMTMMREHALLMARAE